MCAFLRPIDRRFLPHSMTVFNPVGKGEEYVAVVIRHVNFADSNTYSFRVTGTNSKNAFRVIVDCVNSDFGGRVYVPVLEWQGLSEEEQRDQTRFTLHLDMPLFRGEHECFPDGAIIPASDLKKSVLDKLGLRLLKTNLMDVAGLEEPHHMQLGGDA